MLLSKVLDIAPYLCDSSTSSCRHIAATSDLDAAAASSALPVRDVLLPDDISSSVRRWRSMTDATHFRWNWKWAVPLDGLNSKLRNHISAGNKGAPTDAMITGISRVGTASYTCRSSP